MNEESDTITRNHIQGLIKSIHVEDYANIVIFIIYLSKDSKIITSILEHAKSIYEQHEPCNFESDIKFLGSLTGTEPIPLNVDVANIKNNNSEFRQQLDEAEELNIASLKSEDEIHIEKQIDELAEKEDYEQAEQI